MVKSTYPTMLSKHFQSHVLFQPRADQKIYHLCPILNSISKASQSDSQHPNNCCMQIGEPFVCDSQLTLCFFNTPRLSCMCSSTHHCYHVCASPTCQGYHVCVSSTCHVYHVCAVSTHHGYYVCVASRHHGYHVRCFFYMSWLLCMCS